MSFIARDLSRFDQQPKPGTFDFITTFDADHDQASPRNVLRGIRISLADDGVYLAQDIKASSDVQHTGSTRSPPALHDFVPALHDGVIGARCRWPRGHVGCRL